MLNIRIQVLVVGLWMILSDGFISVQAEDTPRVVVSIAPIHSLVTGIMAGVTEPELLIKSGSSPHGYMLKPSQVRSLQRADMIVWIGESIEGFLPRVLANLDADNTIIELMDIAGMTLLPARKGGVLPTAHDEDDHGHHHEHGDIDGHLWLDISNAKTTVRFLVDQLSKIDPQHATTYRENGEAMQQALTKLDQHLEQQLRPVRQHAYMVFHDAYQYFEHAYGLNPVGTIMIDPEHKPGARRLTDLRQKTETANVYCIFSEPQFSEALIKVVAEGTAIHTARLDPMGMSLQAGKALYFDLMKNLGTNMATCLGQGIK